MTTAAEAGCPGSPRRGLGRRWPEGGQDGGFAGPEGHAVHQDLGVGEVLDGGEGQVPDAHGAAAGDEDQVGGVQGRGQGFS